MEPLQYTQCPVDNAYDGAETLNVRQLKNLYNHWDQNFRKIERSMINLESAHHTLQHKLNASYDFIAWVQTHSPETMTAYKAHNDVMYTFDKAERSDEFVYPQTGGSA